jgi:hypothetical protein
MQFHVSLLPLFLLIQAPAVSGLGYLQRFKPHPLTPVANVLAKGEGDWNSVNRGRAGDTPGGIASVTGKKFSDLTVGEVRSLQQWQIYAVGRYQIIPSTLAYAVQRAGVAANERFTPEVQNKLLWALLEHKRPLIGAYIKGEHENLDLALREMAREWASVAWYDGGSFYSGRGGNAAHVTRHEAAVALREARALYLGSPTETSHDRPTA